MKILKSIFYTTALPIFSISAMSLFLCSCDDCKSGDIKSKTEQSPIKKEVSEAQLFDNAIAALNFNAAAEIAKKSADKSNVFEKKYFSALRNAATNALENGDFENFIGYVKIADTGFFKDAKLKSELLSAASEKCDALFGDERYELCAQLAQSLFAETADINFERTRMDCLLKMGKFKETVDCTEKFLQKNGAEFEDYFVLLAAQIGLKDFVGASKTASLAAAKDKYDYRAHIIAARAFDAAGETQKAVDEYALALYYSKAQFPLVIECGDYFIKYDKLENFKTLINVCTSGGNASFDSRVAAAYLLAKASEKENKRNFKPLDNVVNYAPMFIDAHFLYADWLMDEGGVDAEKYAYNILDTLAERFKRKNDEVNIKIVDIVFKYDSFASERKKLLSNLAQKYFDSGYGSAKNRAAILQLIDKAISLKTDADYYGELLKNLKTAELKRD